MYPTPERTPGGTIISKYWDEEHIQKVIEIEIEKGRPICGGKTMREENEGAPCKRTPGYGTDHPGEGRCKNHGGNMPSKTGKWSVLRHRQLRGQIGRFFDDPDLMNIRSAVATTWAVIDTILEEDNAVTPERAQEIVSAMGRISTMIKQHHDITEGQKIVIEVPQFMEWAEHLYELAIKYILLKEGDVPGFLKEAQSYYSRAVGLVVGHSPPALGPGDPAAANSVLRSAIEVSGDPPGAV